MVNISKKTNQYGCGKKMTKTQIFCFSLLFLASFSLYGSEKKEVEALGQTWSKFTVQLDRDKVYHLCSKCNQTATYIFISRSGGNHKFCETHKPKETPILVCPKEWGLPE